MKKQISFMVMIIMVLIVQLGFSQSSQRITDLNIEPWVRDIKGDGQIIFCPLSIDPQQIRGLNFHFLKDTNPIKIRLKGYERTKLKDITELKYSTFTANSKLVPFVVLQVRYASGSGPHNAKLVYEPRFQYRKNRVNYSHIKPNEWQQWDLCKGYWWVNKDDVHDPFSKDQPAPFYTIKQFLALHSNAVLVKTDAVNFNGDAIRLTAGGRQNSDCYANYFTIGTIDKPSISYYFEKEE